MIVESDDRPSNQPKVIPFILILITSVKELKIHYKDFCGDPHSTMPYSKRASDGSLCSRV